MWDCVGEEKVDWCFDEQVREGVWMKLGRSRWQLGWMDVDDVYSCEGDSSMADTDGI